MHTASPSAARGMHARASQTTRSRGRTLVLVSGIFTLLLVAGTAEAANLPGAFRGDAYATFGNAKAGDAAASLGRSAFVACSCEGTNGRTVTAQVSNVSAGQVLTAANTQGSVTTSKTKNSAQVQNTATVSGLNALNGLITAGTITASAEVDATASSMTPSSSNSLIDNLNIAGQAIPSDTPPNTVKQLPGIGTVTINKVTTKGRFHKNGTITVEMLVIDVTTKNNMGLAVGSEIVVAHAQAGFDRDVPADVFGGNAYAATGNDALGGDVENEIGKSALLSIPCQGTGGKTKTNSIGSQNTSGVLSYQDGYTTAFAGPQGGAEVSLTTAQADNVNLIGGLITAGQIKAVAQDSMNGGVETTSTDGSGFSGLSVAGVQVPIDVPPNTIVPLPGIGTVTVNEQIVKQNGNVTVNGLHVKVSTDNPQGLPVGSELILAHASASAKPY
ncbi:MAG TPA: choice-of-anchor P family protein [Rhizomicrobium sp.]|nr:choice-of-anchor P family protein [Rhizomicrobium sp.]